MNGIKEGVSPTPKKVVEMDFPTAIQKVIEGEKITKLEWHNKFIYGELRDDFLMLKKEDNKFHPWLLSEADMRGEDWVIIE